MIAALGAVAKPARKPAKKEVRAVVSVSLGIPLGGTVNGRWKGPDDIAKLLHGGERYRLYSATKRLGWVVGSKPKYEGDGVEGYTLNLAPEPDQEDQIFAFNGNWNALSHAPKFESTNQAVYKGAVAEFLKKKGIKITTSEVRLTQVWRVDLEGDGSDEVLISASSDKPENMFTNTDPVGDYSLVILRKIVGGKVKTIEIAGDYTLKSVPEDTPYVIYVHELAAVLDLNGDGKMEVLTHYQYYEGEGFVVYQVRNGRVVAVTSNGVGA